MKLDEYQSAFVSHEFVRGECVVLKAVAGSGKTTSAVKKIQSIIETGTLDPEKILFITFSNKSAQDLTKKYTKLTGLKTRPNMSTIHSFCMSAYRKYTHDKINLLSEWNSTLLMRDALEALELGKKYDCHNKRELTRLARGALDLTHWFKSMLHLKEDITEDSLSGFDYKDHVGYSDNTLTVEDFRKSFLLYETMKRNSNQMDYSDLVYNLYIRMLTDKTLTDKLREAFPVVFVDECQDLDMLLYEFIFHLSKGNNLFLIGDRAQTIYGFRWAAPHMMDPPHLRRLFASVVEYSLRYNYRSTKNIVNLTNIARGIIGDDIISIAHREEIKGSVKIQKVMTNKAEGKQISRLITQFISEGYEYRDIAILARTNSYLKTIVEPIVSTDNIPYRLHTKNRKKFFDKPLVQAYFSFISLMVNPDNDMILIDLANHVKGIGDATVSRLRQSTYRGNGLLSKDWGKDTSKVNKLFQIKEALVECNIYQDPDSLINILRVFSKIVDLYFSANFTTSKELDLIGKSISTLVFTYYTDFGITSLQEIFERVLLDFTEIDMSNEKNAIFMGTIHGAKGLEFPVTIVGDHGRWVIRDEDSFDEGCILHVALSRAIDKLVILHSNRYIDASFKERDSKYTSVYSKLRSTVGF